MLQKVGDEKLRAFNGKDINTLIEEHIPFIIKSISETTGRYVSVENSEEFSIGLLAFNEAIEKYDEGKGSFLAFAKLVISSRVKTYLIKNNKQNNNISMEELNEAGIEVRDEYTKREDDKEELVKEVQALKYEIGRFGFDFEELVDESPKHKDTRENTIMLSENISKEKDFTDFMYEKFRLPIKKVVVKFHTTEKIVKRNKKFIISVVIIFYKKFRNLKLWIRG